MMKYLVTGARGQLGAEFVKKLKDCYAFGKEELDISNLSEVLRVLKELKPHVVINCAAYNYVDKAEEEFERALQVNAFGVLNLAVACKEIGAFFVHYSTDYVFDGKKEGLYIENDRPNPINKYGLTKYIGEEIIPKILDNYLIFRTSWVYGEGKQNFLYKLSQWAKTQEYLRIACDEFSVPTSTRIIVEISLLAIEKGLTGLYHLVCSNYASRYEWAKEYLKLIGIKKFIYPVYQTEFKLSALRPRFSAMSNKKLSKILDIEIPSWDEELKRFLQRTKLCL